MVTADFGVEDWGHCLEYVVDGTPVELVRPCDTERPTWVAYENTRCLGTLHALIDTRGTWHVQTANEEHVRLDDAVRALRRPPTWSQDRDRARQWARDCLNDPRLLIIDIQTTGLHNAWAVQIGLTDRHGTALVDELVHPRAEVEPAAVALHGISAGRTTTSPTFSMLLPELTGFMAGRRCLSYNAAFDRGVLERELRRHYKNDRLQAEAWLQKCTWEDAMRPYAAWKGLWSARYRSYRYQPLGGVYKAVANCRRLLSTMQHISH
ncbi:3'-5' exonuclease [Streptomyces sp. 769]|uniref:3'-5' exonuclease n=1 Tax=Streptomyces sp. 769 TaxID=1262452 RepID=UPI000581F5CF|nr:3'-5' exonuclease [Streptomyces sp. 769]AJC62090.1 exonuclease RNase T and DNA polymerase III [Streptomyces sp. 769]